MPQKIKQAPPNLDPTIFARRQANQAAKRALKSTGSKPNADTLTPGISSAATTFAATVSGQGVAALKTETTRLNDAIVQLMDLLTAKGSLWVARDADTAGGLDVGANDTILVADSAQTLGVKWQALSGFGAFTEAAQDAVGAMVVDTATIDLTYSDATPSISADVIADSISNTYLANMAEATIKGRASGAGTGDPTDLTAAQLNTIIETTNGPWHAHRMSVDTGTRTIAAGYSLVVPNFEVPSGMALEIAAGGVLMVIG